MSKDEANSLLHKIASTPIKLEKTAAEIEHEKYEERKKTSDELSEQAIELESMSFSAKDLNNFTAFSGENANKSHEDKMPATPKEVATLQIPSGSKSFYE